jgi:hypothetical protein
MHTFLPSKDCIFFHSIIDMMSKEIEEDEMKKFMNNMVGTSDTNLVSVNFNPNVRRWEQFLPIHSGKCLPVGCVLEIRILKMYFRVL